MTAGAPPRREWLWRPRPRPEAALQLVCIPYAGGSAQLFRAWPDALGPDVEVCALAAPGRGARTGEAPIARLDRLLAATAAALRRDLDRPFALFGHSVGALVAFELARELRRRGDREPEHLFVSALRAPHLPGRRPAVVGASEEELVAELRRLGGTPQEVLAQPELLRLTLPALRADLTLWERYRYREEEPLAVPLTALGGREDREVGLDELRAWEEHTRASFRVQLFDGGHFFVHDQAPALLETIDWDLGLAGAGHGG